MRCSTGAWFEDEVETFIQTRLADYHDWRRPHTDHTIVGLELAELGLVAVGSHESDLIPDGGQVVTSTYLECAAVRTDLQGAVLSELEPLDEDGRPVTLGRYLLEVLLSDISERQRVPIVRAVVAREKHPQPTAVRARRTDPRARRPGPAVRAAPRADRNVARHYALYATPGSGEQHVADEGRADTCLRARARIRR